MINEKPGLNKKILLGMPNWFLFEEIKKKLKELGFEVIDISFSNKFKYASNKDRLISFIQKNILGNKDYKARLNFRDTGKTIRETLQNYSGQIDYALLIRADYYSIDFIKSIKEKVKVLVGYQWDGLDRFSWIKQRISLFDRFFVFDPSDINFPKVLPSTNFFIESSTTKNIVQDIPVYYLGIYTRKRVPQLINLANQLNKINVSYNIKLISNKESVVKKYHNELIDVQSDYVSYEENLELINRSRIIVDLLHDVHKGLSFRVFEAIGKGKKLILNNPEILKYEFYDPTNFFLVKDENYDGLEEFINTPYKPLPEHIKEKYSFDNWIRYVLDIQPYLKIELPK